MAQHLTALLNPSLLAPRPLARRHPRPPQRLIRRRQRLLTRPVLVASVVGLVWRRVPAVAAGQKVWARAGLWGGPPLPVSPQALPNRLDVLLAAVLGQLGAAVWTRVQAQAAPSVGHPRWAPVREHCPLMALGDGAPLAALRQRTQVLREGDGGRRAGKTLVLVAAFSHGPRRRAWRRCPWAAWWSVPWAFAAGCGAMPARGRSRAVSRGGGSRRRRAPCRCCVVAQTIGTHSFTWASTARIPARLHGGWSRGGGRARGSALRPLGSMPTCCRPVTSVSCLGDAGGSRRRVL